MPRMTLGGYGVPAVGAEGFDEESNAIKRRRLQLEALLAEPKLTGAAGGIANLALGLTKGYHEGNLREQEQDLASRRSAAAQQWLERMPTGTPAQAEVNPSIPQAGEEGPPLPTNYAPPEPTGGLVPQMPTYEHKAATPFLPANLQDTARWSMEGAGFSPLHAAVASHTVQKAIDAPVRAEEQRLDREAKAELAREGLKARAEENLRRHEDRLADNKREERRLEDAANDKKASREDRAQAQRSLEQHRADSLRLQGQAAADRAEARGEKKSDQEKQIVRQTEKFGHQMNAEKIAPLDTLLTDVEKELEQYKDPKAPGGYKDIPGVGIYDSKKPEAMLNAKELKMRRVIEPLRHLITVSGAGLSQTEREMKSVLEQDLGLGSWSPDASFSMAIPVLRKVLETRKNAIASSFEPEAVDIYNQRFKANTPAAAPSAAPAGAPAAEAPLKAKVEAFGMKYEPESYEYRVTTDGKVQRRKK